MVNIGPLFPIWPAGTEAQSLRQSPLAQRWERREVHTSGISINMCSFMAGKKKVKRDECNNCPTRNPSFWIIISTTFEPMDIPKKCRGTWFFSEGPWLPSADQTPSWWPQGCPSSNPGDGVNPTASWWPDTPDPWEFVELRVAYSRAVLDLALVRNPTILEDWWVEISDNFDCLDVCKKKRFPFGKFIS